MQSCHIENNRSSCFTYPPKDLIIGMAFNCLLDTNHGKRRGCISRLSSYEKTLDMLSSRMCMSDLRIAYELLQGTLWRLCFVWWCNSRPASSGQRRSQWRRSERAWYLVPVHFQISSSTLGPKFRSVVQTNAELAFSKLKQQDLPGQNRYDIYWGDSVND